MMTRWHTKRLILALVICCITILGSNSAFAQAQNITGVWDTVANNGTGVLDITQDNNNVISGTILGDQITGRYLPSIRRLVFVRLLRNGTPFQLYEAHVSMNGMHLAGSFMAWNSRGGASASGVDFNFSAKRTEPLRRLTVRKTGTGTGTVTSTPAGINCGRDCSESYPDGTRVNLRPTAGFRSIFSGWSGDCRGFGGITVTMDRDRTCTALFESIDR